MRAPRIEFGAGSQGDAIGPLSSRTKETALDIQGLGYVGIRAKSLEDWTSFGTKFLGMQLTDKSAKSLALRMDDRKQRVVVSEDGGEGVGFFGWEVADAATLERFAAKLEKAGVQVARGTRALADERRVKDLIVLADPLGNRIEIVHGPRPPSSRSSPAATFRASAPGRSAWATRCYTSRTSTTRCRSIATCSASD